MKNIGNAGVLTYFIYHLGLCMDLLFNFAPVCDSDYIDKMMDFMEASRNACGSELEVLECKIVLIRAKVDEMKRKIADLDMFLGSLEKLGNAAAETAFMANAEYASVAMSERQHSLCTEVWSG